MSNFRILRDDRDYTFSQYFLLPNPTEEIVAEFGYSYERESIDLLKHQGNITYIDSLEYNLRSASRLFAPASEIAVRECLIMPILLKVCDQANRRAYSEYLLSVDSKLKGTLDYYIPSADLLVIEAKQFDIRRGFTQLAVEMIALDKSSSSNTNIIYGAVSNGDNWRFGVLNRVNSSIREDTNLYRVPEGLESLVRVLLGILLPASN